MVEKTKKRLLPILLTVMIAVLLVASGASILGVNYAHASAEVTSGVADTTDGADEVVSGTAAFGSPSGTDSRGRKYWNFGYTGGMQSITGLPIGYYQLEVWGAAGGNDGSGVGGKGGYAIGGYYVSAANTTLYVGVGGQGASGVTGSGGGYNGGGNAGTSGSSGGGGGATHISKTNATVAGIGNGGKANILIVAGGGGGGGNSYPSTTNCNGGAAGVAGAGGYGGAGTQTAGGGGTNAGGFGQGGHRNGDGGGGGGGLWGGGACTGDGGGGGGSGYTGGCVNVSTSQSSTAVTCAVKNGNVAFVNTTINTTTNETGHAGHGYARITQLNTPPKQTSVPTISIKREAATTITMANLNLTDTDPGNKIFTKTAGVYVSAATTTPANTLTGGNYWVTWSMSANAESFTITALRWWSGTKTLYVNVYDKNGTNYSVDLGSNVWVAFNVTCTSATLTQSNGPTDTVGAGKFSYGSSNTQIAKEAGTSGKIFNPVGNGRRTVYLADSLSLEKATTINVNSLFTKSLADTYDKLAFSTTVTYGTVRYNADTAVTGAAAAQTISAGVAGATNSSYFTSVTWGSAVTTTYYNNTTNTTNYERGKASISLKSTGKPAGNYFYYITVTVTQLDAKGGAIIRSESVDIVYKVDNTRPKYTPQKDVYVLNEGEKANITLANLVTDPDGNSLTIQDVIVPTSEFVLVDKYGVKLADSTGNYNIGAAASYDKTSATVTTNAYVPGTTTGFESNYIYRMGVAEADPSFASTQTQGTASNAYLGYYVNTARDAITIVANKVSRFKYTNATKATGAPRNGDFYILVRVRDAGEPGDAGIWYPIAVKVNSATPKIAGVPSINGAPGSVHYLTPFGVQNESGASFYGIGTPMAKNSSGQDNEGVTINNSAAINGGVDENGNNIVLPFSYDPDNYVSATTAKSTPYTVTLYNGNQITISRIQGDYVATHANRDAVFLKANSTVNADLISVYNPANAYDNVTDVKHGFKEFFTVETVDLYARTSILAGLTDEEIKTLAANGTIRFTTMGSASTPLVIFKGLKITLNKYTMGSYLKIAAEVEDVFGASSVIPIAVNVQAAQFDSNSARTTANFNDRGGIAKRDNAFPSSVVYEFDIKVGEELYISPYDLFEDTDTYKANIYGTNGSITKYNTVPFTDGHSEFMKGVNKKITVIAGSTAAEAIANTTATNDFGLKKLYVANIDRTPVVSGKDLFGNAEYREEVRTADGGCAEYFVVTGKSRTPANGYISFKYVVTTSAGDSAAAEIHVRVGNSLPMLRSAVDIINLSASVSLSNSSVYENHNDVDADGKAVTRSYFVINSNTYNVREYTLNDLFYDVDGDSVKFSAVPAHQGITIGTKKADGTFVPFTTQNNYIQAYIGAGSNNRAGYNNCLIIRGLSSTQGVPGGVWIQFYVTDDAIGTGNDDRGFTLQVEVYNSIPDYADMTGDNVMENIAAEGAEVPSYLWRAEYDTTKAMTNRILDGEQASTALDVRDTAGNPVTSVEKPMYIVSNSKVMDYYANIVNSRFGAMQRTDLRYTYASWQVRQIARDPDAMQGLTLHAANFDGDEEYRVMPTFDIIQAGAANTLSNNSVLSVNDFTEKGETYVKDNHIIQLLFFDDKGNMVDDKGRWFPNPSLATDPTNTRPANIPYFANTTTNWIIAFNFVEQPTTAVDVTVRLRDSNTALEVPDGTQAATSGGHTAGVKSAYSGSRKVVNGVYAPEYALSGLYKNNGLFSFSIKIRSQGIFDNMTRFATSDYSQDVTTGKMVSMNNVWSAKDDDQVVRYYNEINSYANKEPFRYEGITISSDTSSQVKIPISYLSFVSNYAKGASRGNAQRLAAFYDIDTFKSNAPTEVFKAFTVSDGYNTWTGDDLWNGNCPYVKLGTENNLSADYDNNPYLRDQQRFYATGNGAANGGNLHFESIPVIDEGGILIEDDYGFTVSKNKLRSVSNLKLSVRMALWQYAGGIWSKASEQEPILITLPITVENSPIDVTDRSGSTGKQYDITTNASTGYTVMLTTNAAADQDYASRANYLLIGSNPDHDQATFSMGSETYNYREDMYFAANSLSGNFTSEQLKHINTMLAQSGALNGDAGKRTRAYFHIEQGESFYTDSGNGDVVIKPELKEKINPHYLDYFNISPSIDSKSISIEPTHMTTFAYEGKSRSEIETLAAARGLAVKFSSTTGNSVDKIYYPLKLMVYDRLTIGNASNTTDFYNASFDIVTINIEIRNSAPSILTRNMSNTIRITQGASTTEYPGRRIVLAKGSDVTYILSELVTDPDMEYDSVAKRYKHASEIEQSEDRIVQDTGDYLWNWGNGNLVKVEYLQDKGNGTAVTAELDNDNDTIKISVNSRINGLTQNDVAVFIKLTFADRYYKESDRVPTSCSAVIEVHISNQAPTLSANAENVRNIEMKTGQYFTLYTTAYDEFVKGENNSTTVGKGANGSYNGTYFEDMKSVESWNSAYMDQSVGYDNQKQSWVYSDLKGKEYAEFEIGKNEYAGNDSNKTKTNLGYMPIALDDAPWSLRIDETAIGNENGKGGVYISSNGVGLISYNKLNLARFEGETGNNGARGYTAVVFEALGACEDVTVSVTLTDGNDTSALGVVYTFKISVKTTKPEAITQITENSNISPKLGSVSLNAANGQAQYADRLKHNAAQSGGEHVYDLKMKVGESISFKTGDFAYDKDKDDTEVLYLLGRNGSDPFNIISADDKRNGSATGVVTNTTSYIALEYEPGTTRTTRNTKFTVTALNFHNDSTVDNVANRELLYDTVQFTISDPFRNDEEFTVQIELRIHVYPSDLTSKTASGTSSTLLNQPINIIGVTEANENGAYAVSIVSKPGEGGLVEDPDAGSMKVRYSVTVYSMLYEKLSSDGDSTVAAYSFDGFGKLSDSDKEGLIVASHIFEKQNKNVVYTDSSFETENSKYTQEFIESISFSADGSTMYVMPQKATNRRKLIANDNTNDGFQLYFKVEKYVDRGGTLDYFDGTGDANNEATAAATVRVLNSTPNAVEVSDANFNARGDGNSYFDVRGFRGDHWKFLLYNTADPAVALFSDPDADALNYRGIEVVGVYTIDEDGNQIDHYVEDSKGRAGNEAVKKSAEDAIKVTEEKVAYRRVTDPADTVRGTFNGFDLAIKHKVQVEGSGSNIVYLKLRVSAYDVSRDSYAEREIVLGVSNSTPTFVSEEEVNERYNYKQNSYTTDENGENAYLTLVLNREQNDSVLQHNARGWLELPILDFIKDRDYDKNDKNYNETFTFIDPDSTLDRVGLAKLSGDVLNTLWVEDGKSELITNAEAESDTHRFNIKTTADNLTLSFRTNTYDRGKSDTVVLIAVDSSGAVTGTLTITLVIGNARPIDKTQTGEANKTLVVEGGNSYPDGEVQFAPIRFSLFDYVTDLNPADTANYADNAPATATTYLTITGVASRTANWHSATDQQSPDLENGLLVAFISHGQYFTVTPLKGLYGTQRFILTVSDMGNAGAADSMEITVELTLQVNPNPTEAKTKQVNVYYKRTLQLTAKDIFEDPEGYVIRGVTLTSNPDRAIDLSTPTPDNNYYGLRGDVRGRTVEATIQVSVGNNGEIRDIPIKVYVADNEKPIYRSPYGEYDESGKLTVKKVLIKKSDIDEDGICVIPITMVFEDKEGDDIILKSAKSVKSSLIGVKADEQENALRFRFNGRGETDVEVRVQDAVSTYTYKLIIGTDDLPEANFFVGVMARIQSNPLMFLIIAGAVLLFLILLIIIIVAVRKKRKMRKEIEALLVSEMELEEQMLRLAAGPSPVNYQSYGYLPPTAGANPNNLMLGSGMAAGTPDQNAAIGLNPGQAQPSQAPQQTQIPPTTQQNNTPPANNGGFNDNDL